MERNWLLLSFLILGSIPGLATSNVVEAECDYCVSAYDPGNKWWVHRFWPYGDYSSCLDFPCHPDVKYDKCFRPHPACTFVDAEDLEAVKSEILLASEDASMERLDALMESYSIDLGVEDGQASLAIFGCGGAMLDRVPVSSELLEKVRAKIITNKPS